MKKTDGSLNLVIEKEIKDSFSINLLQNKLFETTPVYRITYNRIFLVKEGSGSVLIDDISYPVLGNELFLLAKGQVYSFNPDTLINGYELSFGDCFWEKAPNSTSNCKATLFNNAAANQQLNIDNGQFIEMNNLFNILWHEFNKEDYTNKLDALAAYLKIIMIKVANINAALINGIDSYEKQLYQKFIELVSIQYQTTHEVADFAAQLDITSRRLTDLCKRCCGKGAKELINDQLIAEAKRSLQFSSIPVKEIAYHLNFSTPEQFSHFFKNNTQISPNNYREHFVNIGM